MEHEHNQNHTSFRSSPLILSPKVSGKARRVGGWWVFTNKVEHSNAGTGDAYITSDRPLTLGRPAGECVHAVIYDEQSDGLIKPR